MAVAALAVALSSLAAAGVAVQLNEKDMGAQLYWENQAENLLKDVMRVTADNDTRRDAENGTEPVRRQALQGEVIVFIGKSTSNTRCVTVSQQLTCDPDAGDLGNRVNTHLATSPDDFTITVNGLQVCAKREDSNAGWGMQLEIACFDSSPTAPPTVSPTTASPTMSPPASSSVAMYGDPHARNIHGQKFDLHGVENATLLRIPKATEPNNEAALLVVDAKMKTVAGGLCKNGLYMDTITIKGKWAEAKPNDGYYVVVANAKRAVPTHPHHKRVWRLGPKKVYLMVAHGVTDSGIAYLNFRSGNLGKLGMSIGGLLGDGDDLPLDGKQDDGCMSLLQIRLSDDKVED